MSSLAFLSAVIRSISPGFESSVFSQPNLEMVAVCLASKARCGVLL